MKRLIAIMFAVTCWVSAPVWGLAQSQSNAPSQPSQQQNKPAKPTQEANPFPEDTTSVPVMPDANSNGTPAVPVPDAADAGNVVLPNAEGDPVRSPDDADGAASAESSSSSDAGMDDLLKPPPDTGKTGKHGKGDADVPVEHHEGAKEDETVGSYYLDQKNWKAALSRFESAMVLDPENPDVYWGLGEAERHLGKYADAKAHYQKLVEYDPDSKHGKDAKKILKEPDLANAPAVSSNAPAKQQ